MVNQAKKKSRIKQKTPKPPRFQGWLSSDEQEIARRQYRATQESMKIEQTPSNQEFFGRFTVYSAHGESSYQVEIRSLNIHSNSCDCPDHQVNRLGICKHIEATLLKLQNRRKRRFQEAVEIGSQQIEIFLDRRDDGIKICWPSHSKRRTKAHDILEPYFSADGIAKGDPLNTIPALKQAIKQAPWQVKQKIHFSEQLEQWFSALQAKAEHHQARKVFGKEIKKDKKNTSLVNLPLYDYQKEGMLHLAFTGRALLADEMGLGKTVQAIAACALLKHLQNIKRVLVIAPASLKSEWEEQIAKFTDLPSMIIEGSRKNRLAQYQQSSFFYLANYEQVRPDGQEMNDILAPDIIILDEAQRIKNWQTKVANVVKKLSSRYAFVLTGTPIENRIDEIYSIVQFLDPHIFGPLFRFNRDFYQLDEEGRATGYKNLDELHRRLQPIMLRRRKEQVEGELPGRTINNYFVGMDNEQSTRYIEYEEMVARLTAKAKRRPLTKEEMDRLQRWLACMRMLCDTTYILDQKYPNSPKIKELAKILEEILADGDHKIIIFSEWERMLVLVRQHLDKKGLDFSWHTGSTPQKKRREQINRFKQEEQCRFFLSTDSGSVGLNLQVADIVINLDLPWNPAKLEQRIARAWRKHQTRPVQVINIICQNSIEHRMLHLLEQKSFLAKEVMDGLGNVKEMELPSGRAAFLERLDSLLDNTDTSSPRKIQSPIQSAENTLPQWQQQLDLIEVYDTNNQQTVVAVTKALENVDASLLTKNITEHFSDKELQLELLDRKTFDTIQRLIEAGVLATTENTPQILHHSKDIAVDENELRKKRLPESQEQFSKAEHKQRMATVLASGNFIFEALSPMSEAIETALQSLARLVGDSTTGEISTQFIELRLSKENLVPQETAVLIEKFRQNQQTDDTLLANELIHKGNHLMEYIANVFSQEAGV